MNSVQILGNLTRDPKVRATKTGKQVISFSVAVNRSVMTEYGEARQLTDYVNVVAWGKLAEAAANALRKGSRVFVEGRLTSRSYETQDGQKRYVTEVTANTIADPLMAKTGGGNFEQFKEQAPFPQGEQEEIPF